MLTFKEGKEGLFICELAQELPEVCKMHAFIEFRNVRFFLALELMERFARLLLGHLLVRSV